MVGNSEDVQKLKDILNKKIPQLDECEIIKISQQLYEIGLFLVRLQIKKHSKPSITQEDGVLECATTEPP